MLVPAMLGSQDGAVIPSATGKSNVKSSFVEIFSITKTSYLTYNLESYTLTFCKDLFRVGYSFRYLTFP